jgi:hypothetical protein
MINKTFALSVFGFFSLSSQDFDIENFGEGFVKKSIVRSEIIKDLF